MSTSTNSLTLQSGPMRRINVYPDPFKTRISMEVTTQDRETAIVSMLDESGRILRMFSWPLKPGTNKTSLEGLESLPSGNYNMQIKETSGKLLSNVIISKQEEKA